MAIAALCGRPVDKINVLEEGRPEISRDLSLGAMVIAVVIVTMVDDLATKVGYAATSRKVESYGSSISTTGTLLINALIDLGGRLHSLIGVLNPLGVSITPDHVKVPSLGGVRA
ncbi:hypothetical protein F5Y16DRAFT_406839 [Xylariaceae sp. FL0255]|nr:hypothetical protein F5Y16DRAFT_406839 [Xylariaceae sp. FL0255]